MEPLATAEAQAENQVVKTCPTCNNQFKVKPSHAEKRVYCSRQCMSEGYKNRLVGENNPKWRGGFKGGNVELTCLVCDKTFRVFESEITHRNPSYCSQDCYNKARFNLVSTSIKANRKPRPIKNCLVCQTPIIGAKRKYCSDECLQAAIPKARGMRRKCFLCFEDFTATRNWPNKKYCSPECHRKSQGLRQAGPNSHLWQGGKTNRTMHLRNHPLYADWRNKVFKRDEFTCQSCFRTSSELKSGKLTAHHHIRFSDDIKLRFKVSNGITLCWQCHKDFHKYVRDGSLATKESDLMKESQKFFASEPGVEMFKIHGEKFQERGLPDFVGIISSRMVGIELKIFPNYVTPVQQHQLKRIREAGGVAFVCRSIDEVKRVVYIVKETAIEDEI